MKLKALIMGQLTINQDFNFHQAERNNSLLKLKNYSILSMMAGNSILNPLLEMEFPAVETVHRVPLLKRKSF